MLLLSLSGCYTLIGPSPDQTDEPEPVAYATSAPASEQAQVVSQEQPVTTVTTETPTTRMVKGKLWMRIPFESGQKAIDAATRRELARIAGKFLAEPRGRKLVVQGFCDNEPIGGYDGGHVTRHGLPTQQALSQARAESVASILINAGVPGDAMIVQAFGDNKFVADNSSDAGREQNRRVDVFLIDQ